MRSQGLVAHKTPRSGGGANLKAPLKELFVCRYEDVFNGRSPISTCREKGFEGRQELQRFWDELLLLKVNEAYLAQCIASIPEDRLIGPLKPTINEIFAACLRYLGDVNFIRVAHALETLAVFLREVFKKRFGEQTFTIITLVAGNADSGDAYFKKLICDVSTLLTGENVPVLVKALGTRLFLVLLTATDNVNANPVASYLFLHPITDPLLALLTLSPPHHRQRLEFDTSLVLLLLLLWRRAANPYADRIASTATAPLVPLLHTIHSLLSLSQEPELQFRGAGGVGSYLPSMEVISSQAASALSVVAFATSAATQALYSYASTAIGGIASGKGLTMLPPITSVIVEKFTERGSGGGEVDSQWAYGTCGVLLLYFLVALNPTARSPSLWPHEGFIVGAGKSISLLWGDVLRLLLLTCRDAFEPHALQGEGGLPRAKVLFLIARLLLEERHTAEFLFRCDPATFLMHSPEPPSPSSPAMSPRSPRTPSSHPVSSMSHAFFNMGVAVLSLPLPPTPAPAQPSFNTLPPSVSHSSSNPPSSSSSSSHPPHSSSSSSSTPSSASSQPAHSMDPDALVRAAVVVSLVVNFARAKGCPSAHQRLTGLGSGAPSFASATGAGLIATSSGQGRQRWLRSP
ncbi:hypothetical protein CLOM_g22712 [Closterium sp. NIES-68]|nr:hypothetical protein CLOM_g22712 [Closterium sp. NIES-68]